MVIFFLSETQFDFFYENLITKINISRYYRSIDRLNSYLINHDFIGSIDHAINKLNFIFDEIEAEQLLIDTLKDSYTDTQLLKFVDAISRCILPAVADIRRLWRWDIKRNEQIKAIINNSMF